MTYSTGNVLLTINHVSYSINGNPILKDVDRKIYDIYQPGGPIRGQIVGFLAPSGMGKSTLFNIIAGLRKPTQGSVYLNSDSDPIQAGMVGVLAQDYPLDETRTVLGNLLLAAGIGRNGSHQCYELAKEKLNRFGLWDIRDHYPCQLSGGQRQRVAYLQQTLCSRQLMLDDEPFSGLDHLAKKRVAQQIVEFAGADEKNTVIITSHDARMVCAIADHIWLLGRDHDDQGNSLPGARIQKEYDLVAEELAWHENITAMPRFQEFVTMIEEVELPKML